MGFGDYEHGEPSCFCGAVELPEVDVREVSGDPGSCRGSEGTYGATLAKMISNTEVKCVEEVC